MFKFGNSNEIVVNIKKLMRYIEKSLADYPNKEHIQILLITSTELETKQLHARLESINGNDAILKLPNGQHTYYLAKLGLYNILHVQCSHMGAVAQGAAILTITNTLETWRGITAVIMIGICFGVDDSKQKIADVLVSDTIIPYNIRKIGKNEETPRGKPVESNRILCNIFRELKLTWEYVDEHYGMPSLEICHILSGEELIDNKERRDQLVSEHPTVLGGEMEGIGLANACNNKNIPWILIKGICDFADGNKGQDKEKRQIAAVNSAISCCALAFESEYDFNALGISPCTSILTDNVTNINDLLFDIYDINKSKYYFTRVEDKIISNLLFSKGMWLFGDSGVGKTTTLLHHLLSNSKEVILLNMACCVDFTIEAFFKEIYDLLSSKENSQVKPDEISVRGYLNAISQIIETRYCGNEVYIIVEEIPFEENETFKVFVKNFCALIISQAWQNENSKTRFVLSSIYSPLPYILKPQQKARQFIDFYPMQNWSVDECLGLIDMIILYLRINVTNELKMKIISDLDHSPRKIKAFFRTMLVLNANLLNDKSIDLLITETKRQF